MISAISKKRELKEINTLKYRDDMRIEKTTAMAHLAHRFTTLIK